MGILSPSERGKNMIKYEKPIFEILIVTDIITTSGNEEYEGEIDWM